MLHGRREIQKKIKSLGHYFNPSSIIEDKLDLVGSNYALLHSILVVVRYFGTDLQVAWARATLHEQKLQSKLLAFLASRADIATYGSAQSDATLRVPIMEFTVNGRTSQSVVEDWRRLRI